MRPIRSVLQLAAAVVVAGVAPRAAQAQACTTTTLADYLVAGFACDVGTWRFSDFSLLTSEGTLAATAVVTPFWELDGLGRRAFGFRLADYRVAASAGPDALASANAEFSFSAATQQPDQAIGLASADVALANTVGAFGGFVASSALTAVQDLGGGAQCLFALTELAAPGSTSATVDGPCSPYFPTSVFTTLRIEATAGGPTTSAAPLGAGPAAVVDASAAAAVSEIRYVIPGVVVPEPSTYALLGTGLLALGGVAARRRRG